MGLVMSGGGYVQEVRLWWSMSGIGMFGGVGMSGMSMLGIWLVELVSEGVGYPGGGYIWDGGYVWGMGMSKRIGMSRACVCLGVGVGILEDGYSRELEWVSQGGWKPSDMGPQIPTPATDTYWWSPKHASRW